MPRYSAEEKARWVELYKQGLGYESIAKQVGCSHNTVAAAIKAADVDSHPIGGKRKKPGDPLKWFKRISTNGYICWDVWVPKNANHSFAGKRNISLLEHRMVMEVLLGRPLTSDESVHHKNGDRADNRPENLELRARYHGDGATHCPNCGYSLGPIIRDQHEIDLTPVMERVQNEVWGLT